MDIIVLIWPLFLILAGLVRVSGYLLDRHPRSPTDGIVMISISGIILSANLRGEDSLVQILAHYWFWLLLALIANRIFRQYTHQLTDGPRPKPFPLTTIVLMVLITGAGLAANYGMLAINPLP